MHLDLIKIKPYKSGCNKTLLDEPCLHLIELLLAEIIPEDISINSMQSDGTPKETFISPLEQSLPIIDFQWINHKEHILRAAVLCPSDFTQGVGRFFIDTLSKLLLPGKMFSFFASKALCFNFVVCPEPRFYIAENCIDLETAENVGIVKKRLDSIAKQLRLTILAVMHARKLVNSKKLSSQEKHMLLMENLLGTKKETTSTDIDDLFSQSYKLLSHAYTEKIEQSFQASSNMPEKPTIQMFDHNIFKTIYKEVSFIFEQSELSEYPLNYLNKLVSYCYLFQKLHKHAILNKELGTDSIKLLHLISEEDIPIPKLGVLIGLTLDIDIPEIQEKLLIQSMNRFDSSLYFSKVYIFTTLFLDKKIMMIYFEASHSEGSPFLAELIKRLKTDLLSHLKTDLIGNIKKTLSQDSDCEELGVFLNMHASYYKRGIESLVHTSFLSSAKRGYLVAFIIITKQNIDTLYLEKSKLHGYEVSSHQKKIIGIDRLGHLVNYHTFKLFVKNNKPLEKASSIEDVIEQMLTQLEAVFGPLHRFSNYFLKKCPAKLIALKKALPQHISHYLVESIYFSLSPRAHRLSLSTDHLTRFILFVATSLHQLKTTTTITHTYNNHLWVLSHGSNMKRIRSSLRLSSSLSITELYTSIDQIQFFGAIVTNAIEKDVKKHVRNIVDDKVQLELGHRLRLKKRASSTALV